MKEIFVFGAGASYASAGTPLGKDLVWTYHRDCVLFHPLGSDGRRTNDSIKEEQEEFEDLRRLLRSRQEFEKYDDQLERDMKESMTSNLDVPKRYYVDELMRDLQKENNEEMIVLIKRLTVKHIIGATNGQGNRLYREFCNRLNGKSVSEVCVFSMNFDCHLHEEFKENNVYKPVCFDYLLELEFEDIAPSRRFYKKCQGKGIPLIKLNGSLDWAYNRKTNKINLLHWHISDTDYFNDGGMLNNEIEPYIFLPHQQKDKLIKPLWDKAEAELRQATKITIIGYSFPDYDTDVLELFQKNIKPEAELEIVDLLRNSNAQEHVKSKYRELFSKVANVKFDFGGFQGYMARWLEKGAVSCQ